MEGSLKKLLSVADILTSVRNLLKLGTFKRQAILTALSRKGSMESCPHHCDTIRNDK